MENRIGNALVSSGISASIICSILGLATPLFFYVTMFFFAWGIVLYLQGRLLFLELMIPVIMGVSAVVFIFFLDISTH